MLGAYLAYTFITVIGINVPLSALMAVAFTALVGMAVDRFCIKPMRERHVYVLIITLALAYLFQELVWVFYGSYGKSVESFVAGEVSLGQVHVSYQKVLTLFVSGFAVTLLWFFIKKTKTGKSVAAVAQNKDAAILMGIQYERVYLMTMAISAGLAALAGVFIAPQLEAVPGMWTFPLFKAFAIVIIGGLGSIEGAVVAAMLLGYAETSVSILLSPNYTDMVYLLATILILVVRPTGLMSKSLAYK